MLSTNAIRIVFLRLTQREPTADELEHARSTLTSTAEVEAYVRASVADYLGVDRATYAYDRTTDTVTATHLHAGTYAGVRMSNGHVGFVTSASPSAAEAVYVKSGDANLPCIDVTGVELRKTVSLLSSPFTRENHVQRLHLSECRFEDAFDLKDAETGGTVSVAIDRYPLHTVRSCLVQRIRVSADYDVFLDLVHVLRNTSSFDQFVLTLNEGTLRGDLYEITNDMTIATTLTHFVTPFAHKQPRRLPHGSFEDVFEFHVAAASSDPVEIYVVSSLTKKEGTSIANRNIIRNLFHNTGSGAGIVQAHVTLWRDNFWNTTVDIASKASASEDERADTARMVGATRRAIFAMYSDIGSSEAADVLLFGLPVLIYLKPAMAQELLEALIERLDPTDMYQNLDRLSTRDHVMQNMSRDTYFVYCTATLAVHVWNFFRATVDRNWLLNTGYPAMRRCCDFLLTQRPTNNTVVDYMVSLAYRFMYQTMYELNYVQTDRYPTQAYACERMDGIQDVTNAGTTFYVRVEREDDSELRHFAFYDVNDRYLGYKFGGTSGYRLALEPDTVYTFKMMFSLSEYPIRFVKPVTDYLLIFMTDNDSFYVESIHHPIAPDGTMEVNSNELVSFGLDTTNNNYNTFRNKFDTSYGMNAFGTHTLRNVLRPHAGYAGERVEVAEPYVLLNSYYGAGFFKDQSPLNNSHRAPFIDVISDTTTYFEHNMADTPFNLLLQSGLEHMVGQHKALYTTKRAFNVRSYYHLLRATRERLFRTGNWLYDEALSAQLLFMLLTSVLELTVVGEIRKDRIMVVDYGVAAIVKHALPEPWAALTLTGAGVAKRTHSVLNTLLADAPFDRLADGFTTTATAAIESETVDVALDFTRVFPRESLVDGAAPSDFDYHVYLQATDDETDYTTLENRAAVLQRPELQHRPSVVRIPFVNAVPDTTPSEYEVDLDETLVRSRTLHLIYNRDDDAGTFGMTTRVLAVPDRSAPDQDTVSVTLEYERPDLLTMRMVFNSLSVGTYKPFSGLTVMLTLQPEYADVTRVSYDDTEVDLYAFASLLDSGDGFLTLDATLDAPVVSPAFALGTLKVGLVPGAFASGALAGRTIADVVSGIVIVGTDPDARIVRFANPEAFPPAVMTPEPAPFFTRAPALLRALYTEAELGARWYSVLDELLECTGPDTLGAAPESIAMAGLVATTGGDAHTVLTYHDADTGQLSFMGVGANTYGQALVRGGGTLATPTACDMLDTVSSPATIHSTTRSTLVLSSANDRRVLYAAGYNGAYNLGTGTNTDHPSSLVEASAVNGVAESLGLPISLVVPNEDATLIVFGERTVYGLGRSVAFFAPADSGAGVYYNTPTPMAELNSFLAAGGYAVERVDTGKDHFKLRLRNAVAEESEWWGIGRNASGSMGLDERLGTDAVVRGAPKRLRLLEELVSPSSSGGRYELVRSNGVPATLTVAVDRVEGRVYALGSFVGAVLQEDGASLETVAYPRWTEILTQEAAADRARVAFVSMRAGGGFLMGRASDPAMVPLS